MSPSAWAFCFLASIVIQALRVSGSPRCATCGLPPIARDAEERLMVEVAKQQLLAKLHLKERPNITQAVPRAALLTALRKLHSGRVRQDGTLDLENNLPSKDQGYEIVSFADIREEDSDQTSLGLTFQFLQESSQNIQVLQSSLWVYVHSLENPRRDSRLTAQVFLSTANAGEDEEPASNRTLLMKKTLEVRESNWHTFPIGRTLQAYLDSGRSQLRLEVTCEHDRRNLCLLDGSADSPHTPFVVAKVRLREQGASHALRKRSLRCGEDVTVCCKRDFYVKFKDIQWSDWIIAPEGYHMNYCMGQCSQHLSGTPGISSSFHASVFSQLKVSGVPTAMSSCCIPTERQALSIVYFNSQHSIVKTDIPDMIVESCGCT